MKKLLTLVFALIWAQSVLGQDYFTNLREGQSRFIGEAEKVRVQAMIDKHGRKNLKRRFREMFQTKEIATCASKVVKKLSWLEMEQEGIESLAYAMREMNVVDDIVLDIVLKRNRIKFEGSFPAMQTGSINREEIEAPYVKFRDTLADNGCEEDAFFSLTATLYKQGIKKNGKLKAANKVALKMGIVDQDQFELLESFRRAKVQYWRLSLRQYSYKLRALRRQIDRYGYEEGNFVTKENKKAKASLRQYLFENFDYLQILMMGNLVEKMRKRLDSVDISILIRYADDEQTEIIPLEPTERFRFVLKLLRKEMTKLNQSNLFGNTRAHYAAVIAASYEIGSVPAIELEELASLEDIWNPEKTRMQRVMTWARMFGGVASVVIPGPFAFLPVLAVMVVDGFVQPNRPEDDQDISLF